MASTDEEAFNRTDPFGILLVLQVVAQKEQRECDDVEDDCGDEKGPLEALVVIEEDFFSVVIDALSYLVMNKNDVKRNNHRGNHFDGHGCSSKIVGV